MSEINEKVNGFPKPLNLLSSMNDISNKFYLYRAVAESNEKKLKEAETVIDELKERIDASKEVENNLRCQLESSQTRLIQIQKYMSQFLNVSVKQQEHEKILSNTEQKLNELNKMIIEIREKSNNLYEISLKESNLIKENKKLRASLDTTKFSYDLLQMQLQTSQKEKTEMESQFRQKFNILQNDLENSKREIEELRVQFDTAVLTYKKQIEKQEATIKEYEKERRSFLEDFEQPARYQENVCTASALTHPDSTVNTHPSESFPIDLEKKNIEQPATFIAGSGIQSSVQSSSKVKTSKALSQTTFSRYGKKENPPPLNFLSSQRACTKSSSTIPNKRRLFSNNDYHYLT